MDKIDFIGVGVPKAGTTWIAENLNEHPDILFSSEKTRKEINFFNKNSCYFEGLEYYLSMFPAPVPGKIRGEFSPTYFYDDRVPLRIKNHFPNVKILISLRNPIRMMYSLYWYAKNAIRLEVPETFERAIEEKSLEPVKLTKGLFYSRLTNYYDNFNSENIQVVLYDDIEKRPDKVMESIQDFLGVDHYYKPAVINRKSNPASRPKFMILRNLTAQILDTLEMLRLNKLTKKLGSSDLLYQLYCQVNKESFKYPEMESKTYLKLVDYFEKDIKRTAKLLNRDLSSWLKP